MASVSATVTTDGDGGALPGKPMEGADAAYEEDDALNSDLEDALVAQMYYAPSEHDRSVNVAGLQVHTTLTSPLGQASAPLASATTPVARSTKPSRRREYSADGDESGGADDLMFSRFVADQGDESILARIRRGDRASPGSSPPSSDSGRGDIMAARMRQSRYFQSGGDLTMTCYNCGQTGHRAAECTNEAQATKCFLCGQLGHDKRNCPNELCFNCNQPGHMSRDCPRISSAPCSLCRTMGHLAVDCVASWRRSVLGQEESDARREGRRANAQYCPNCAARGHGFGACRAPTQLDRFGRVVQARAPVDKCHRCGAVGHYARDCPRRWSETQAAGGYSHGGVPQPWRSADRGDRDRDRDRDRSRERERSPERVVRRGSVGVAVASRLLQHVDANWRSLQQQQQQKSRGGSGKRH